MKKFLPFVFPAAATLIVLLLAFRWYTNRTQRPEGAISPFAEGVNIENLTETEINDVRRGVGDVKVSDMTSDDSSTAGSIRYEIAEGKVRLSVAAQAPALKEGQYQVWFKDVNGTNIRKAFVLAAGKGGYIGSAAISEEVLPFEVIVSKEMNQDETLESVILRGVVTKEGNTSE